MHVGELVPLAVQVPQTVVAEVDLGYQGFAVGSL